MSYRTRLFQFEGLDMAIANLLSIYLRIVTLYHGLHEQSVLCVGGYACEAMVIGHVVQVSHPEEKL